MISILVTLLVVLLIVGIVFYVLSLLPIPQPWLNIARAIVGLIVLIILIQWLLPFAGHPALLR